MFQMNFMVLMHGLNHLLKPNSWSCEFSNFARAGCKCEGDFK